MLLLQLYDQRKSDFVRESHPSYTHNDQGPFIRGIEGNLEHLRVLLQVFVIVGNIPTREACKASLSSISQNLSLIEWNVRLVKLDARIESGDVNGFTHARRINGECCSLLVVVIGLRS